MNERDGLGRFTAGNSASVEGGRTRARTLPAERRRQIASEAGKKGFAALAQRWFDGDREACKRFIAARGAWAADQVYRDAPGIYKPFAFPRPTAPWETPVPYDEIVF